MTFKFRFRKNANSGSWCCLLIPLCLLPPIMKYSSGLYFVLFNICLCSSCYTYFTKEIKSNFSNKVATRAIPFVFSMVSSFITWYFFSYDYFLSLILCLMAISYYIYLVKSFLNSCPGSFTLGEVQIIAQGIMLFLMCCTISIFTKLYPSISYIAGGKVESILCLQILLAGCLLLIHTFYTIPELKQGIMFFITGICVAFLMLFAWNLTLRKDIVSWLWTFCLSDKKRMALILFWLLSTFASIVFVILVNRNSSPKVSTMTRKYFHVVINAVFIPGILYDIELLRLASVVALAGFIVLEMCRVLDVPLLGSLIEDAFKVFLDEKDSGLLILTHIYLLIGCSSPIWLAGYKNKGYHLSYFSGVISVGFGDTAAAIGGSLFGKHYWKGSRKTYEGSACAFITQILVSFFFLSLGHKYSSNNVLLVILAALLTSILEAKTTQVDNLVLPLFMFSILSWVV